MRYLFAREPQVAKRWLKEHGSGYLKNLSEHAKRKAMKHLRKRRK